MSGSSRARSRVWHVPAFGVLSGLVFLVAGWIGDGPGLGLALLGIMLAFSAAVLVLARRSETVRGLLDRRDERINLFEQRANVLAGGAMVVAALIGAVVELGRGHSGAPYTWLCAIFGLAYLGGIVIQRVRG